MTLTPSDMFEIQSAMDRYEKAFPRKPSPSPAEALAWRAGRRGGESRTQVLPGECGVLTWVWESCLVWWQVVAIPRIGTTSFLQERQGD
jgi:hypothetical protein